MSIFFIQTGQTRVLFQFKNILIFGSDLTFEYNIVSIYKYFCFELIKYYFSICSNLSITTAIFCVSKVFFLFLW